MKFTAKLSYQTEKTGFKGGLGQAGNFRTGGFIDVEIKNKIDLRSEKLRIFYHYSPIEYNSSALFERLQAFLKFETGINLNNTSISYSFSPLSSVYDRDLKQNNAMIIQGFELKQKIGNLFDIESVLYWGQKSTTTNRPSASYFSTKSELGVRLSDQISLIAFYDFEKLNTGDPSVIDSDRAFQSKTLSTVGGGFRFNIYKKENKHRPNVKLN